MAISMFTNYTGKDPSLAPDTYTTSALPGFDPISSWSLSLMSLYMADLLEMKLLHFFRALVYHHAKPFMIEVLIIVFHHHKPIFSHVFHFIATMFLSKFCLNLLW